jgi:hypothetical protein
MERTPITVMSKHRQRTHRKYLFGLTLLFFVGVDWLMPVTLAQSVSISRCGHSTVADAWGPEFAARAEMFLAELQHIVGRNDKAKFANLVHYPIQVSVGDNNDKISTSAEFIQKYPSIVTPALKQAIISQDPKCLFANGQGVMIGHGQLWFQQQGEEMKIITITLDSSDSNR